MAEIDGSPIGHDEVGNLISQGYKTFNYASNGRLSEVKTSGAPLGSYHYDALGQRREKTLGTGPQTRFVYDWQGRLVSEIRDGSVTEYLYLAQQPIAVITGGFLGTDGDKDNDGIADSVDNCSLLANPDQVDTDGDGYGNRCDTDLNNDGVVDNTDLALFAQTYITRAVGGRPNGRQYNPMMDFNNDRAVNPLDLWIFKVWFFSSEGPGPGTIDQTDDPQLAYIHFEHRGAPTAVSNEAGGMIWQAHFQPFGEVEELTDVDGDGEVYTFNLRYPGQYHDRESGYYYNYFRDYDPATGRYVQSDPVGLDGGLNTYSYVGNNPLIRIDQAGLDWIYSQSTGNLFYQPLTNQGGGPPAPVASGGYSGNGAGYNNPSMQNVPNVGPIPQGSWTIGTPYNSPNVGPSAIPLTPNPGTNDYGRTDFRIHGDNSCMCANASEGCVIFNRHVRNQIINSGDPNFIVVP
ncbi:MAG: RHS repeat-associated core domain-containing protein [Candidatus Thiodiazotropha sp.]